METLSFKINGSHQFILKILQKLVLGSATRFGAITGNGEGEKVLGQIMMLKDGNSKSIIDAVKERVASIQKTFA